MKHNYHLGNILLLLCIMILILCVYDAYQVNKSKQTIDTTTTNKIITYTLSNKVYKMRVTGYLTSNVKSCIGEKIVSGGTAAVSPNCIELLGETVYIKGYGIRKVNDLTADWLDDKFNICTLDLAVSSKEELSKIDSKIKTVVKIGH